MSSFLKAGQYASQGQMETSSLGTCLSPNRVRWKRALWEHVCPLTRASHSHRPHYGLVVLQQPPPAPTLSGPILNINTSVASVSVVPGETPLRAWLLLYTSYHRNVSQPGL